jgi:hypothetical protein
LVVGLEGLSSKIVECKVLISFWDLVVYDGTIVDLVAGCWLLRVGAFRYFIFSDLSSPVIYPPGPLWWLECQVLVDIGRVHGNMIFFAYKFRISKLSVQTLQNLTKQIG